VNGTCLFPNNNKFNGEVFDINPEKIRNANNKTISSVIQSKALKNGLTANPTALTPVIVVSGLAIGLQCV
jgi:hypothetical protein